MNTSRYRPDQHQHRCHKPVWRWPVHIYTRKTSRKPILCSASSRSPTFLIAWFVYQNQCNWSAKSTALPGYVKQPHRSCSEIVTRFTAWGGLCRLASVVLPTSYVRCVKFPDNRVQRNDGSVKTGPRKQPVASGIVRNQSAASRIMTPRSVSRRLRYCGVSRSP